MKTDVNDPLRVEMRRYRSMMEISCRGILMFGIWSAVKCIFQILNDPGEFFLYMSDTGKASLSLEISSILMLLFIMAVDLAGRLYIAKSALDVSKRYKKKKLYIFLAVMLFVGSILTIVISIADMIKTHARIAEDIVTIMIEITAIITVSELIYSSVKFRRARNRFKAVSEEL